MDFMAADRKARDQHLPVVAVRAGQRFGADAIDPHRPGEILEGIGGIRQRAAGVDFLQRDDVRIPSPDEIGDAHQIETRIEPQGAVNIPRHDADVACPLGLISHRPPPQYRDTATCTPIDNATQAPTASTSAAISNGVGDVRMRANWLPTAEIMIIPGSMPSTVPAI